MTPYYSRGGIVIYHGDCREIAPSLAFESVLTDPPYGIGMKYGAVPDTPERFVENVAWLVSLGKKLAFTLPVLRLWEIPKPQWVAVWHKPMCWGFWSTPLYPHWEPIALYGWPTKGVSTDVFRADPEKPNGHPSPKPVVLFRQLAALMDGPILDPFCGSGTTLIAARDCGRLAVGIEREERYCEIAAKRLAQGVFEMKESPEVA